MNSLARALRKNSTEAERCLWSRLRGRRLDGVKFRRQQVLGPYVVDFLCLEPKVVIEVDGGQHAEQVPNDLRRTEYLKVLGYRVIRFWNHDVLGDPDAVLESIRAALVEVPSLRNTRRFCRGALFYAADSVSCSSSFWSDTELPEHFPFLMRLWDSPSPKT